MLLDTPRRDTPEPRTGLTPRPGRRMLPRLALGALLLWSAGCTASRHARRAQAVGIEWVAIPGGEYVMGDVFEGTNQDALPLHRVTIAPFEILRYEVTYRQYDGFARDTGRTLPPDAGTTRGDQAVVEVDWDDALAFCAWIGSRLPSEREWEFAAAGGPARDLWPGTSDPDSVHAFARLRENSVGMPGIVGLRRPNRYGLFDMGGNVAEWIGAFYQFYPEDGVEPDWVDLDGRGIRILRGGSYSMEEEVARTYWRAGTLREVRSPAIGFRCARDA